MKKRKKLKHSLVLSLTILLTLKPMFVNAYLDPITPLEDFENQLEVEKEDKENEKPIDVDKDTNNKPSNKPNNTSSKPIEDKQSNVKPSKPVNKPDKSNKSDKSTTKPKTQSKPNKSNIEPFEFFEVESNGRNNNISFIEENFDDEFIADENYDVEYVEEYIEEKVKNRKTIQYTFDLKSQYPVFNDTGISVGPDGEVSMDGLVEFFTQLAIHKNGKVVQDQGKVLLLLDKKIIIAYEGETKISDVIKAFDNNDIKVTVQNSRVGGKYELAERLELTKELPVYVNDEEITLISDPMLIDSKVLFPIRSIATELGANINWNKAKGEATITKNGKEIVFTKNSDIATVNGKEYQLSSKTSYKEDEMRIFSIIRLIVEELGAEMYYDTHDAALKIETDGWKLDMEDW